MSACRKLSRLPATVGGPLLTMYRGYLEDTKSEIAAAILALDAYRRDHEPAAAVVSSDASAGQGRTVLTPPQVAKQLGVDPATVIGWIRSGQLKASNLGKGDLRPRYRVQPGDLDAFLKKRQPALRPSRKPRNDKASDVIEFF